MLLLRFTFENHRSFRDEADLTLVDPHLRTSRPATGSWIDHTSRVAAIYGPNASGKSGVLGALRFMRDAIADSATTWSSRSRLPRSPFALDDSSRKRPSSFVLNFALNDVRYEYGFSINSRRVLEEWLYSFPASRRRMIFERSVEDGLTFGREFGAGGPMLKHATEDHQLALSKAGALKLSSLAHIHTSIVNGINVAQFDESDRSNRLRAVISDVVDGSLALDDLRTMLRVADIGISGAEVREREADPQLRKLIRAIVSAQANENSTEDAGTLADDESFEQLLKEMVRGLAFDHTGADGKTYSLPSNAQSTGTLTWLSLAAPAIKVLRQGGVLAVDEIDASLHPQLAQVMVQMFRDGAVNTSGAQLIFTTHDTYFLSPVSEAHLAPDEVWFVEKSPQGVSGVYRLSDFPTRPEDNFSRRYLQGRYGAVPAVAPSFLSALATRVEVSDRAAVDA